jgi:hypothetical protein
VPIPEEVPVISAVSATREPYRRFY